MRLIDEKLPNGWRLMKLGDICEINPSRPYLNRSDLTPTTFVQMSAVDDIDGVIARPEIKPYFEVKKGYTYFEENDVIFAKITPCMENGKHAIARNLTDGLGFGSTEFHVIRPNAQIMPEWIWYFVRQPYIRQAAMNYFTGAVGQQRVPDSYLKSIQIPLPPLPEQQRIAARLNEQMSAVAQARQAAEEQLRAARELPAAYLQMAFDGQKAKTWRVQRLAEVSMIGSGITLGRKLSGVQTRKVPYLRVANVKDGFLDISDIYEIDATNADIDKCTLKFGDLLLTEGGDPDKLGRGTFWEEQIPLCLHQNHIFRVRFDLTQFSPRFMSYQIGSPYGKAYFLAHAKQTTGIATINQKVLGNFPLLIPPFEQQETIAKNIQVKLLEADKLKILLESQLAEINQLPAALLREAFSGNLQ